MIQSDIKTLYNIPPGSIPGPAQSHSVVPTNMIPVRLLRDTQEEGVILACKSANIAGQWNDVQLGMWVKTREPVYVCGHNISCCLLSLCVQHKQAMTSS